MSIIHNQLWEKKLSGKNMGKEFQNDGAFPVIFH